MAVGVGTLPELFPIAGVRLGTVCAGIKTPDRPDLVLVELAAGSHCAAVFTRNAFCAAPVIVAREHLDASAQQPRYLLVNTGNANAGTGTQGIEDARACAAAVAEVANCEPVQVMPFSTGVIGEHLPVSTICQALPRAVTGLSEDGWAAAAEGILTTDTRPKGASSTFQHGGVEYTLTGIAKGSGMIRPNMATMLGYVATDAAVSPGVLQQILGEVVDLTFNRISVDGDTSTNDACVLIATGRAGNDELRSSTGDLYNALREAVFKVCLQLAQGLVRDGEGASKFVAVEVTDGATEQECLDVGFTIAHSPLVKTALFASDPNWGRLLAAIGRAGLDDLDVSKITVHLNDVLIAEHGCRAESYAEELGIIAMAPEELNVRVGLNRGKHQATVWTTDLSYDYVRINAEYRS